MRTSTAACLLGLFMAATVIAWSIRHEAQVRSAGGRAELTFACWGSAREIEELQVRVIDPINARPGGPQVRLIPVPGDYDVKLATMLAGGVPPDLFYLSQEYAATYAARGALLDLTSMVEADDHPATRLDGYYPGVLGAYRHRGRLYGLPWIAQPVIVYCNVGLFRTAGEPLPDRNWNWDRFVAAARRLTRDNDGDGRVDQWGFVLNGWPPWLMWAWQNGADLVDASTRRVQLDDPRVIEALDTYAGLIHVHRAAPPLSLVSESGFSDLFRSGRVAMFMGGAADDLDRLDGLEVVAAEVPSGPSGVRATFAWTAGLHISRRTPDPRRAFDVWQQVLDGIQHWKIPAPRRDLAAALEEIEPRKAASAPVIRVSMAYMRAPIIFQGWKQWDRRFAEQFLDPLLREGTPAADLVVKTRAILIQADH